MDSRTETGADSQADLINRVPTARWGMVSALVQRRGIGHCLNKMRAWDNMATRPARSSSRVWQTGLPHHRLADSTAPRRRASRGMQAAQLILCRVRETRENDTHQRLSETRGRRRIPRQRAAPKPIAPHHGAIHRLIGPEAGKKIPRLSSTVIGKAMATMKPRRREMPARVMY